MAAVSRFPFINCQSYLFSLKSVDPLDNARIELYSICNVSENLLKGVSRLLVEQDANCLPRLHPTADDGDQFGSDEVFALFELWS